MGGLTREEKQILLRVARDALVHAVNGSEPAPIRVIELPPEVTAEGASFVTLTKNGNLRGCIGTLEARQPLVDDVCEHAVEAALDDYRFPPVSPDELPFIKIEISRLTKPQTLEYTSPEDLLTKLRPGVDGVVLRDGFRRATFLPQVWEHIQEPEKFLDQLCLKMGAERNYWRRRPLTVEIYQVEEFHEE